MIRELLDLEPLGDDRFDAFVPEYNYRPNLFGGQVAGQALRAAALTVQPGCPPHSLHSYFVRSGRLDVPLTMQVERIRDGRSYTVRGVEAMQDGEVILDLIASFQVPEPGDRYSQPMPPVPGPDDLDSDSFHGTGFDAPPIERGSPRSPTARRRLRSVPRSSSGRGPPRPGSTTTPASRRRTSRTWPTCAPGAASSTSGRWNRGSG